MDEVIEVCHQKFLSGDRSSIMTILIACSLYQEPIPDWVADELLTIDEKISDNQIYDMNEFFNFKPKHQATLGHERCISKIEQKALDALFHHRLDGGNFTANDGLESVATFLGIGRRVVEEVYKKNKDHLKSLPKNREEGTLQMGGALSSLLEMAQFKRTQHDK